MRTPGGAKAARRSGSVGSARGCVSRLCHHCVRRSGRSATERRDADARLRARQQQLTAQALALNHLLAGVACAARVMQVAPDPEQGLRSRPAHMAIAVDAEAALLGATCRCDSGAAPCCRVGLRLQDAVAACPACPACLQIPVMGGGRTLGWLGYS